MGFSDFKKKSLIRCNIFVEKNNVGPCGCRSRAKISLSKRLLNKIQIQFQGVFLKNIFSKKLFEVSTFELRTKVPKINELLNTKKGNTGKCK